MSKEERQHNIPQLINFSLATGLVVTVGDAVQNLVQEARTEDLVGPTNFVLLALMFALAIKVFMDEHAVLAAGKIRPAIIVDVIFLVSSYCTLIAACTLVRTFEYSVMLIGYYYSILALWNLAAIILDWSKGRWHVEVGKRKIILVWLGIDLAAAAILFSVCHFFDLGSEARLPALIVVSLLLVVDFFVSPTRTYKYEIAPK